MTHRKDPGEVPLPPLVFRAVAGQVDQFARTERAICAASGWSACSRAEIEALLGPADFDTIQTRDLWIYYLGPEPGIASIDALVLQVEFDESGHVVATRTVIT